MRGCILVVASLAGCSLFDPRDAESPSGDAAIWEVPRTPTTVLINMETSFGARHSDFYMRCFDSTMTFEADPLAQTLYPGVFDDWGWVDEEAALRNLLADLSTEHPSDSLLGLRVALDLDDSTIGEDAASLEADYELEAWLATSPERFKAAGRLSLVVTRGDDELWSVAWWRDVADSSGSSWSLLKGRYHS